jgi:hypothetical protein
MLLLLTSVPAFPLAGSFCKGTVIVCEHSHAMLPLEPDLKHGVKSCFPSDSRIHSLYFPFDYSIDLLHSQIDE